MVEQIFSIRGDKIFDVGLRFSLIELAGEYNIKVQPVNLRDESRVQVIVSGSQQSIQSFYQYITNNDVRYLKQPDSPYSLSELKDCNSPNIDFEGYKQSFMTGQLGKILYNAIPMKTKLDSIAENTSEMKNDMNEMKGGIQDMVSTLKNIDKNLSR